jgi:hypothetical protein
MPRWWDFLSSIHHRGVENGDESVETQADMDPFPTCPLCMHACPTCPLCMHACPTPSLQGHVVLWPRHHDCRTHGRLHSLWAPLPAAPVSFKVAAVCFFGGFFGVFTTSTSTPSKVLVRYLYTTSTLFVIVLAIIFFLMQAGSGGFSDPKALFDFLLLQLCYSYFPSIHS